MEFSASHTEAFGYFARHTNVCFRSFKNIFLLIFHVFIQCVLTILSWVFQISFFFLVKIVEI